MKKLAIVAILVLVSTLSAFQVNAQKKIGYVNMQEIIYNMPEAKKADTTLQSYRQDLYNELQNMQKEFQTNAQKFIGDSMSMSQAVKEVKRDELQQQQQRLSQFQQSAQQRISKKQQQVFQPIIKKAQDAVNAVAKAKGYTWVFNNTGDGSILLVKPSANNLTDAVKAKLGIQ